MVPIAIIWSVIYYPMRFLYYYPVTGQPLALIFTRLERSNLGTDELVAQIKKLERVTAVFIETKIVALWLLVIWLCMDYFDNPLEATKPRWPRSIQIDQQLVVLAWCSIGANCHWLWGWAQPMGYKRGFWKTPKFVIQAFSGVLIRHLAEHLLIWQVRFLDQLTGQRQRQILVAGEFIKRHSGHVGAGLLGWIICALL